MKSTTVGPSVKRNILILLGICVGIFILSAILENVATFLAFYFA